MSWLPTVRVEVGFSGPFVGDVFTIGDPINGRIGSAPIGSPETWVDISEWVRSWQVRAGASQGNAPTRRYDAATASIVLNDGDRRFDPDNLAGPYVSGGVTMIAPMRRVRITAEWNGVAYPLFTGFADDWVPDYQGNDWTYTTLTATDATKVWAAADRTAVALVGVGELTGARINRTLNSADWPVSERVIDAGSTTLQQTDLSGSALAELQLVQDTEGGEFFADQSGKAVFQGRASVFTRPASVTSQATFGDGGYVAPRGWDFEDAAQVADWGNVGGTMTYSTSLPHSGAGSALFTCTGGTPARPELVSAARMPVTPGSPVSSSAWLWRSATTTMQWSIKFYDAGGVFVSAISVSEAVSGWTPVSVAGTVPAGAAWAGCAAELASPSAGTTFRIDDVQMQAVELPYADVTLTSLDDHLANRVTITRVAGTPQTVEDAASIADYLVKSYAPGELIMETDGEALNRATGILYRHKDPARRFARIEFTTPAPNVEDVVWPALLGRYFGDRIAVIRRPAGGGDPIAGDVFVRGYEHSSDGERWDSALILQAADKLSYFTIGHPDRGRIGAYPISF